MENNPDEAPKSNLESEISDVAPPLWNPDIAGVWSLFLTPIFGSTLVLINWKSIGDSARTRTAWIWLIVSIIMLIPTALFPGVGLAYIIIWYFIWQRKQTKYVKEHWGKDYPSKGWSKPLLIGIGVMVVMSILGALSEPA